MPEILGRLRPPRLAAAPSAPALGEEYYNTGTNTSYYWNGTAWVTGSGTTVVARAYRNAAFTLTAAAWTKIPIDTTSFDTTGIVQIANGRFVVATAGYYQVEGGVQFVAPAAQRCIAGIYKNGVVVAYAEGDSPGAGSYPMPCTADVVYCNAGDNLELWAYCTAAYSIISGSNTAYLTAALLK